MSDPRYRVSEWCGYQNYECTRGTCRFSTVEWKQFEQHLERHAQKDAAAVSAQVRPLSTVLYDARERQIESIETRPALCGATTTTGEPCRNSPKEGHARCYAHLETEDQG